MWQVHRLEQTVLYNLDLGLHKRKWFREYLELEDNETFESKIRYYDYNLEAKEMRDKRLNAKGWYNVKQSVACDDDHLLGRMRMWMNASIFTMNCSHSWNQCVGKVRTRMGCWGFAFANIKYNGGN